MFFYIRKNVFLILPLYILLSFSAKNANADNKLSKQTLNENTYGFRIGATRVIYNQGSPSASFWIKNEQEYPIIVQTQVLKDDRESKAPFIVTPPILRVDSNIQTRLRVIPIAPLQNKDSEELFWICVKGVPPKEEVSKKKSNIEEKSQLNINIITNSCIKLISRPERIELSIKEASKKLVFKKQGDSLVIENKTPVYINISKAMINGKKITIPNGYIRPYSKEIVDIKYRSGDKILLVVLDDYGAEIINEVIL
ncbi:TPA: fimbria/pilus periplasmic chaperone [Salmonella enterica]|uniref:Fimbria/pilus periplasmic chaperone n=2 Tax=Salmonella enterica TaxID=28901 RepID=A0A763H121_SALER|nr:fimbria/pilus periplasmic chaperone [Salmonella enterica subsp. enterica serovar Gaminara]EED2506966.1 fimbria/pilus periplasmic chaperone [Salmonella enterica subsp. enterica serovar Chester]EEP9438994.1 fimbria/pilus periplasmic chaperone [Salmonella enterica subsp. enterica serovar Reading]EJC9028478.1 fimbria/pilus periplasmic chaperone [Salmonella enterica]HEC9127573.1 fimbria/pilus periplasmic chaperone [Salmonella enterica subsp. enterica serovar Singapore]